jgi:hypothetical protein
MADAEYVADAPACSDPHTDPVLDGYGPEPWVNWSVYPCGHLEECTLDGDRVRWSTNPPPIGLTRTGECPCSTASCREDAMVVVEYDETGKPRVWCDPCIEEFVHALLVEGLRPIASCCGHRARNGSILLADGRELLINPGPVVGMQPLDPAYTARLREAAQALLTDIDDGCACGCSPSHEAVERLREALKENP